MNGKQQTNGQQNRKGRFAHWLRGALLRSLLVILLVTAAVFFLIRLVPGDPGRDGAGRARRRTTPWQPCGNSWA